jgi:N-acetylglucosamine kinase-like BadF-type ATPase
MGKACDLILGIDGGGTKTTALLAEITTDDAEKILGRGHAGTSNIKAVGVDNALANLQSAIDAAWQAAGGNRSPVAMAVFGLSGAGRPETQAVVNDWCLANGIAKRSQVVHDALPVLMAGTPAGQGVALIAGTGAVAYAVNDAQKTAIAGGWGYWFGDEGSAFWLGQAAARAVSEAADGRGPETRLTELILNELQIAEPREILSALGRDGADVRFALAKLAPLVTQAAEQNDPVAGNIVIDAAQLLAALVAAAASGAQLNREFALALAGGVICHNTPIRAALLAELAEWKLSPTTVELVNEPAIGCLRLAAQESISHGTNTDETRNWKD